MGSFNEVCALSGLPIVVGCPVKVLFLDKNPFDNRRGCYPQDRWHVRTLPLDGIYNDYGLASINSGQELEIQTIEDLFDIDSVEVPITSNYRVSVKHGQGLDKYMRAANEGSLSIQYDTGKTFISQNDPDWQKIQSIMESSGFVFKQSLSDKGFEYSFYDKDQDEICKFKVKVVSIKLKRPAWGNPHYNILLKCVGEIGYIDFDLDLPYDDGKDRFKIIDKDDHFIVKVDQMDEWLDYTWKLLDEKSMDGKKKQGDN